MTRVFNKIDEELRNKIVLTSYAVFCIVSLLCSTVIFHYGIMKYVLYGLMAVSLMIFAVDFLIDYINKTRKLTLFTYIIAAFLVISFLLTQNPSMLILISLIIELSKFDFKKIISTTINILRIFITLTIFLSVLGILINYITYREFDELRYALGFSYCTVVQGFLFILILLDVYLNKTKLKYSEICNYLLISSLLYFLTDARLSYLLSLVLLITITIIKFVSSKKDCKLKVLEKNYIKVSIIMLPLLCLLFSFLLVVIYNFGSDFSISLNSVFSDRLSLMSKALQNFDLTLFGEDIIWKGWGYDPSQNITAINYNYVDNGYFRMMFDYGIVGLGLIIIVYSYALYKSIKDKDYWLTLMISIILITSIIDPNLTSYPIGIFLIGCSTLFIKGDKYNLKKIEVDKTKPLTNKNVIAVILTYNRKELLKESLEAVLSTKNKNLKILVVDNNSTDGTEDYIKNLIDNKKVLYMNTGENLGGAGGFNFGIKEAIKIGCDYIWIMDDDCIVHNDSLDKLLEFANGIDDNFGYLSSVARWTDGSLSKMNIQRVGLKNEVTDFTQNQEIKLASFVSLFIRSAVVEDLGLPIKDFFIWGDDWEYTDRISREYPCYLVADSVVTHKSKSNIGVDISKDSSDRLDRYFYAYRNERYFYRKNGLSGKLYNFLKVLYHKLKITFSKSANKKEKLKILKSGYKAGKTFDPEIEFVRNENSKIKVVEFFAEPLQYGGQEAFILNMYKNFSKPNIEYTIATPFTSENTLITQLAEKRKEEIIAGNYKFFSKKRKLFIKKFANEIFSHNKFDVVHIHSGSVFALLTVAKIAKNSGVKKVIIHSHATGNSNLKYKIIKYLSDRQIDKYVDEYFACSKLAAEWKFPRKVIDDNRYKIINNGIEISRFQFEKETRNKYRKDFGLKNELVLCNVGRFEFEKNHKFILQIASSLKEKAVEFKCILVGSGSLKDEIINDVEKLDLKDNFIFLEKRSDVPSILMASDIFLFPSLFEGLGLVAIESQATGLYTIASDNIPQETNITDIIKYLPIDDVESWVRVIMDYSEIKNRKDYVSKVANAGFDASETASKLEDIYLS